MTSRTVEILSLPEAYFGWWRILETSQWGADALDLLGPAMFSIFEGGGRWRMVALVADVEWHPRKEGLRFTLDGSWELASGIAKLNKDGRIEGTFCIKQGDSCTFIAERTTSPHAPIATPPSPRKKWGRRW